MPQPANLRVLERSFALIVALHRVSLRETTRAASRAPGLAGGLLRSATAIASHIVEGAGQATGAQFARCLALAISAATDTEHQLELAMALELFPDCGSRFVEEVREIRRMLHALRRRVLEDVPTRSRTGAATT